MQITAQAVGYRREKEQAEGTNDHQTRALAPDPKRIMAEAVTND
jgi:hypothetical protein